MRSACKWHGNDDASASAATARLSIPAAHHFPTERHLFFWVRRRDVSPGSACLTPYEWQSALTTNNCLQGPHCACTLAWLHFNSAQCLATMAWCQTPWLLCRLVDGHTVNTQMGALFQGHLSPLFTAAYRTSGCAVDAFTQLCGLLDLWATRGVYAQGVTDGIKAQLFAVVRILSGARPSCPLLFYVTEPCCASILCHSAASALVLLLLATQVWSRSCSA